MRDTTQSEIEYLNSIDGNAAYDQRFIDEMSERLDALRRLDQTFSPADWRPHAFESRRRSDLGFVS